jgi:hypothetical protein
MSKYLWLLATLCLVGLLVLAGSAALAQAPVPSAAPVYVVEQGRPAGGGYQLAAGTWQVHGTASSLAYQLQSSILQGAGCCCTYLPCLFRQ